jgi:thiol-disulfide isomerase/thioredoxin
MSRRRLLWLALGLGLSLPVRADVPQAGSAWAIEADLLHRPLHLGDLQSWNPQQKRWQPLASDATSSVTVLHLWSPRCAPCVEELPLLARLLDAWQREPSVRFLIVADHEGDGSELVPLWQAQPALWQHRPLLRVGSDKLRDQLGVQVQPLTLLIDDQQVIRQAFVGPLAGRSLGSAVTRLLSARPTRKQSEAR